MTARRTTKQRSLLCNRFLTSNESQHNNRGTAGSGVSCGPRRRRCYAKKNSRLVRSGEYGGRVIGTILFTAGELYYWARWFSVWQIAVTAQSRAWTVFARSNTGVVDSNPTRRMDVYVRLFCICAVLCVSSGLATCWSPVQGVLQTAYRITKL
jgi:hypothetical protein